VALRVLLVRSFVRSFVGLSVCLSCTPGSPPVCLGQTRLELMLCSPDKMFEFRCASWSVLKLWQRSGGRFELVGFLCELTLVVFCVEGMKLVLDFIPNQTSRSHEWFRRSRRSRHTNNTFKDFYVWRNGGQLSPDDSVFKLHYPAVRRAVHCNDH